MGYSKLVGALVATLALASAPVVNADGPSTCIAAALNHDSGSNLEFVLHRPRSRKSGSTLHPDWQYWNRSWNWSAWQLVGLKTVNQKDVTFQILNAPPKANIEYIAIFSAGQQTGNGFASGVSGHSSYWRKPNNENGDIHFPDVDTTMIYPIDKRSPAYRFAKGFSGPSASGLGTFKWTIPGTPQNTLVINIFDAAFEHTNGDDQKWAIVAGWSKFLSDQVIWPKVKGFIGYGMSRGGCFLTKFSDYLIRKKNLHHLKIILETLDSVCTPYEVDWPTAITNTPLGPGSQIDNPVSVDFDRYCNQADLASLHVVPNTLNDKSNVCWKNTFGGASAFLGIGHAFCHKGTLTSNPYGWTLPGQHTSGGVWTTPSGHTWLDQKWINKAHCQIGRFYPDASDQGTPLDIHEQHMAHLNACADKFFNAWTCQPWTTCTANTDGKCGGYITRICTNGNSSIPPKTEKQMCSIATNPCVWGDEVAPDPTVCRKSLLSRNFRSFYKNCGVPPAGWTKAKAANAVANSACSMDGEKDYYSKPLAYCTWSACQQVGLAKKLRKSCNVAGPNPILPSFAAQMAEGFEDNGVSVNSAETFPGAGFTTIITPSIPAGFIEPASTYLNLDAEAELQNAEAELQADINVVENGNGSFTVNTTQAPTTNPYCLPTVANKNYILSGVAVHEAILLQDC